MDTCPVGAMGFAPLDPSYGIDAKFAQIGCYGPQSDRPAGILPARRLEAGDLENSLQ